MKVIKRVIIGLLATAGLLAAIFLTGRYGWKLLGFRACEGAGIERIEVRETEVEIKGFYPGSFPEGFCGYYAKEWDGRLYVGFHFSAVFGLWETGDFAVTIPVNGPIETVILKTRTGESQIWPANNP